MKLDTNRAWESGMRFVRGNKELLAVIGGLLFFIPGAASAIVFPTPEAPEGATTQESVDLLVAYYSETWWVTLLVILLSGIGSLAIYRLAASRDGRTVSGALSDALKGLLPWLGASLLFGIPVGMLMAIPFLAGGPAVLLVFLIVPFVLWLSMRTILIGPVVMAEGERNPVAVLKRSFALTKGNSLRIFVFLLLLIIAAAILLAVVGAIFGLVFIAIAGADTGKALTVILAALLETVFTVIVISCVAMIYRQLAAPPASAAGIPKSGE